MSLYKLISRAPPLTDFISKIRYVVSFAFRKTSLENRHWLLEVDLNGVFV